MPNLTTVPKAAAAVDLSTRTIWRMLNDGRLTPYRLPGGRAVRVDLDELVGTLRGASV